MTPSLSVPLRGHDRFLISTYQESGLGKPNPLREREVKMKKMLFVLVLVALLLTLGLSVVSAGMDFDDPCPPGYANNGNARCFLTPPPGLGGNDHGNAGNGWIVP
jgi:hypothetical protein